MIDVPAIAGRANMIDLSYCERLILWGMRRIVRQRGADAPLLDECYCAFDGDGDEALRVLCLFVTVLGRSARQTLEIGLPNASIITRQESRVLMLLGAAQKSAGADDWSLLDAHLQWFSIPTHRLSLAQAAITLAGLLAAHGHFVTLPAAIDPPVRRRAADARWRERGVLYGPVA